MSQEKLILQSNMLNAFYLLNSLMFESKLFAIQSKVSNSILSVLVVKRSFFFAQHYSTSINPNKILLYLFTSWKASPYCEGPPLAPLISLERKHHLSHHKSLIENGNFHDKLFIPLRKFRCFVRNGKIEQFQKNYQLHGK